MFLRELGDKISWQPDVSEVTFVKCLGKDVQATDVAAVLKNTSDKVSGSLGASGAHVSSMIGERIAFLLSAEIRALNTAGRVSLFCFSSLAVNLLTASFWPLAPMVLPRRR